jgi:hypothetical protein
VSKHGLRRAHSVTRTKAGLLVFNWHYFIAVMVQARGGLSGLALTLSASPPMSSTAAPGPSLHERLGISFSPPDSDESFAFDRPPYASEGGVSDVPQEHASSIRGPQQQRSDISSVYAQGTRQPLGQFGTSQHQQSGSEDDEEGGAYHDRLAQTGAEPLVNRQASVQYSQHFSLGGDGGDEEEDGRFGVGVAPQQQGASSRPDDGSSDGHTLSELEQMLNQTIQKFNIEEMRVPSSKDMAFGMAHGDGPFDISDIWAVDSQPSGSQRSASQRPGPSEGSISRGTFS